MVKLYLLKLRYYLQAHISKGESIVVVIKGNEIIKGNSSPGLSTRYNIMKLSIKVSIMFIPVETMTLN